MSKKDNKYLISYGEAIGTVTAQSIGEPTTQMVLGSLHSAGTSLTITTTGLPRIIEILDGRKVPKKPSMTLYLEKDIAKDYDKAKQIRLSIESVSLEDVTESYSEDLIARKLKIELSENIMKQKDITVDSLINLLQAENKSISVKKIGKNTIEISLEDKNKKMKLIDVRDRFNKIMHSNIKGIREIKRVVIMKDKNDEYYFITEGSNIKEVLNVEGIDKNRIYSNNPFEMYEVYGIEAARATIIKELHAAILSETSLSLRHVLLVADTMTYDGTIKSIGRHGVVGAKSSVFARAAFEETVKHFVNASIFNEIDRLNGVAENILIGKQIKLGTGRVILSLKKSDLPKLLPLKERERSEKGKEKKQIEESK
ncbi:MAG: DNA-directed RNA polymerase subunit A'' [Candidatus Micrarchaeota archaeon]|nr:MAG: DNA-directed RNA polymerase subunit A'' [Candidatus Micrarchaeota archaeon]